SNNQPASTTSDRATSPAETHRSPRTTHPDRATTTTSTTRPTEAPAPANTPESPQTPTQPPNTPHPHNPTPTHEKAPQRQTEGPPVVHEIKGGAVTPAVPGGGAALRELISNTQKRCVSRLTIPGEACSML